MTTYENPDPSFWHGKRVLLTGHTGFKGAWLAYWLHKLGATVIGISLPPDSTPNLFTLAKIETLTESHFCDIRDAAAVAKLADDVQPDIVFHLAAQALVRASYCEPLETLATNILGTANILDGLRPLATVRVVIAITTDKVYENVEQTYPYRETDPLGGHDPYSASKAAAEIVIASYRDSFLAENGVAVASARAGNVIGGGDWSEDRLIPDTVRAWHQDKPAVIRRPQAIRPWQHVLDPLAGYLRLAERLWREPTLAGAFNFGPATHEAATVREVVELARAAFGKGSFSWDEGNDGPHEAGWLALEVAKARNVLDFESRWLLAEAVQRSMSWYGQQLAGRDAAILCGDDVAAFEAAGCQS